MMNLVLFICYFMEPEFPLNRFLQFNRKSEFMDCIINNKSDIEQKKVIMFNTVKKSKEIQEEIIDIQKIIGKLINIRKHNPSSFILTEDQVCGLCFQSKVIFMSQPMLLELNPPINVCGDIHGQYVDLKQIFKSVGTPTQGKNFLFLGDYVDRGKQSLECICLLLAYKIQFPEKVFLLRGNHECSQLNKTYGFYDQCKRRLTVKVWNTICEVFRCLPAAAVIGDRIFCVHGGLSPFLEKIQSINQVIRPIDPQKNSLLNDLLWSDPTRVKGWSKNLQRGTSHCFGEDIVERFVEKYDFDFICRSHQVAQDGYEFFANRKLLTIFSCPNYCGMYDNYGAVLIISSSLSCHIKQFQKECYIKLKNKRQKTPIIPSLSISSQVFDGKKSKNNSLERRRTSLYTECSSRQA